MLGDLVTPFLRRFGSDELAATMVEYSLMVALVAAIAIAAVRALGGTVNTLFSGASGPW